MTASQATESSRSVFPYAKPRAPRFVVTRIVVSLLLLAIVFWFVGKQLYHNFKEIPWNDVHIQPAYVGLAMLGLLLGRVMNGLNCKMLLAAMGEPVPARKVLPIVWVAAIGRYIPGKVAVVGGALVMLMQIGIRLPLAMAALFMSTALMMLSALIMSTPILFTPALREKIPSGPVVAIVTGCIGIVCLSPPVFLRLCNLIMRVMKRPKLPDRMNLPPFFASIGLTIGRILVMGTALWLGARALIPISIAYLPTAIAAAGLASAIGFLAVFAPAGLGVHEEIYLITMQSALGPQVGLLVVLFRLYHLVADIIMAAFGASMRARDSRKASS